VDDPPLVIVSTAQQLKSTVREPVMLMLSSFLRVLVVSALVHGVAAAAMLLQCCSPRAARTCPCAAPPNTPALPSCASHRATMPCRRPSSPPAGAARRAAGRDLSYQWVGFSNFYSFDENL